MGRGGKGQRVSDRQRLFKREMLRQLKSKGGEEGFLPFEWKHDGSGEKS